MAKQTLQTNFVDDILEESMSGKRRYNLIQNDDGTVSLEDVTNYSQIGSSFGAAQVNAMNNAINQSADKSKIIDNLSDIAANQQSGMMAGALAVRELNNKITFENHPEFFAFHDSCCLVTNDAPAKIGYKGSEVWFNLYFKALNDTLEIGSIDENVLPNGALAIITCSGQSGKSYPLIVHAGLRKIYCDVIIPAGIYGINARWERAPR